MRVEKQDALDQFLGVLHLVDRLLLDERAEPVVAPVVAHLRVQEVLVDGRQLLLERLVELSNDLVVSAHTAASFAAVTSGDSVWHIVPQ